ncbi:MAG: FHA domain-containing protein [Dehalococcoidia bacterium]
MAFMKILAGERKGQRVELTGDSLTVGRSQDNAMSLADDERLSRHHARLSRQKEIWLVEDLSSTNGTFVERSGRPMRIVKPTPLADGDILVIGSLRAAVSLDEAFAQRSPQPSDETSLAPLRPREIPPQAPNRIPTVPSSLGSTSRGEGANGGAHPELNAANGAYPPISGDLESLSSGSPHRRAPAVEPQRNSSHRRRVIILIAIAAVVLVVLAIYIITQTSILSFK